MNKTRLEAFSDGVFAIVITLLVLDLHGPTEHQSIAAALAHEKYAIAAYVVAFFGVGVLWINHHGVLRYVENLDRAVTFVNLVLLLFISATPFTAGLFADGLQRGGFDANVGAAVFSLVFLGVGLTYSVLWVLIVTRPGVLSAGLDPATARAMVRRFGLGAIPYALLVGIAFLSPVAVLIVQGLLGVYYAFDQLDPARLGNDPGTGDATPADPERAP